VAGKITAGLPPANVGNKERTEGHSRAKLVACGG